MPRAVRLNAARDVGFADVEVGAPGPTEIRVRAQLSAISHGTEMSLWHGTSAFNDHVFDRDGLRTFIPSAGVDPYPAPLGYGLIGRVEAVGSAVSDVRPGDLVHSGTPHQEEALVDIEASRRSTYPYVVLPEGAALEPALYLSVGAVALQAVHDAHVKLGDLVGVWGLGAIGLLAVQMARRDGAGAVVAVDPVAERRALALELGADEAIDPGAVDGPLAAHLKGLLGGRGVDAAIETSGHDGALHDAVASAHLGATVVTVGFYQGGAGRLRLGEEWHHNRPTLVSSMGAWGAPHRDAPLWDRPRMMRTVADLLYSGAVDTSRFSRRTFAFDEAPEAYRWLDAHPGDALKVALRY